MASRVQGITIEINGDVTPLQKALSGANKEIKTTQTQLKDVEKLLKIDPKNIDLLTQRERLLAKSVEEVKQKLNTLKEAEKQAQEQFAQGKISQEQYDALQREIIATEQELARLEKAAAQSNATLAHIGAVAQEISDKTGKWAEATKGLSAAAGGVVAALGGAALATVKSADDLNTLSKQTGFTTDQLQEMAYAADLVDVSLDDITSAASRLKRGMSSSSSETVAAFNRLGVSVRNSNGELRNSTDVFFEVIEALGQVENETERDTIAMQLLGRGADQLAGIIDDGGASLRQYGQEAQKMGLVLSKDTLNGLNKVNDRLDQLKGQMKGLIAQNGAKVIEAFLPLIEELADGAGNLAEKLASLDTEQIKTIATIAAVVAGVSPVLSLISKISGAIATLMPILSSLGALMAANPFGAAVIGVTALTAGIVALATATKNTKDPVEKLTTAANNLGSSIQKANAAYEAQAKDIESTNVKAQYYLSRLKELEKQSELTAEEQWEYAHAVEELNGLYPELNLSIDENTGRLTQNIEAIAQQTEALKQAAIQQALQEKFNYILDNMAAAQVEVYENQLKLKAAEENLTAAEEAHAAATYRVEQARNALNAATDPVLIQMWTDELNEAELALIRTEDDLYGAQTAVKQLNEAVNKGKDEVAKYASEYDSAVSGIASIMSDAGKNAGSAFSAGLARGIDYGAGAARAAAQAAANSVRNTVNKTLGIASPSKVAKEIGKYWDEGLVIGLKESIPEVEDTSAEVAQAIIPTQYNSTTNTTTNHNVGGISVVVNGAPGQDVQQLAEAVMEEIQAAVEREGAAL